MDGNDAGPVERLLCLMERFSNERSAELRSRLVDLLEETGVHLYVRTIAEEATDDRHGLVCERLLLEMGADGREVPGVKSFTDPRHPDLARPTGDVLVQAQAVRLGELLRCCDARGVLLLTIDHDRPHGTWLGRENWKDSPLVPIMPTGARQRGKAQGPSLDRWVLEHARDAELN